MSFLVFAKVLGRVVAKREAKVEKVALEGNLFTLVSLSFTKVTQNSKPAGGGSLVKLLGASLFATYLSC